MDKKRKGCIEVSKLNSNILALGRSVTQFRSERMAAYGLKSCHISYLLNICANPGISQDKLAQFIFFNKSNVARQAAVLEEQGYITRQPSPTDKRVMELYPTQKALDLLPDIRQIMQEWDELLTGDLTPEEIETVNRVLDKMREKASAWMNEH